MIDKNIIAILAESTIDWTTVALAVIALVGTLLTPIITSLTLARVNKVQAEVAKVHELTNSRSAATDQKVDMLTAEVLSLTKDNAVMKEQATPTEPDGSAKP